MEQHRETATTNHDLAAGPGDFCQESVAPPRGMEQRHETAIANHDLPGRRAQSCQVLVVLPGYVQQHHEAATTNYDQSEPGASTPDTGGHSEANHPQRADAAPTNEYRERFKASRESIRAASAERRSKRLAGEADEPVRLRGWKASGEGAYVLPASGDRQLFGCITKLTNHEDRQDFLQDHFLRRHTGTFDRYDARDRLPIETTALKRRFLDAERKRRRMDVGLPESDDGEQRDNLNGYWSQRATPVDELATQRADADHLLDQLDGVELEACRLLRSGQGLDDVAEALGLSRSQCYRVRASVRRLLGES